MMWFSPEFLAAWGGRQPVMDELFAIVGDVYRDPSGANRRTLRFELKGSGFFLKQHSGIGWREIMKDLGSFRLPVLGAGNEWQAIRRLEQIGVDTMQLMAYGSSGINPAQQRSFVITKELANCISLEQYCENWQQQPPEPQQKRILIKRVAQIARTLHTNGVNHRDMYICHFLLQQPWDGSEQDLKLYVIDLHRAQCRTTTPRRWVVKDIGSLHFSSMELGLTERDRLLFMREYRQLPLRQISRDDMGFWREVQQRADALYRTRPMVDAPDG